MSVHEEPGASVHGAGVSVTVYFDWSVPEVVGAYCQREYQRADPGLVTVLRAENTIRQRNWTHRNERKGKFVDVRRNSGRPLEGRCFHTRGKIQR